MKLPGRKQIGLYFLNEVIGTFIGFYAGMFATKIISRYFETRSINNLWGFAAKRTIVDKETFTQYEFIVSLVIGFIVFLFINAFVKENVKNYVPFYYEKLKAYIRKEKVRARIEYIKTFIKTFWKNLNNQLSQSDLFKEKLFPVLSQGKNKILKTYQKYSSDKKN